MNVTFRQLRYFLALAQQGHFTRAAEAMNVSQPALSMQIRALEDQVGAILVERTAAGLVLTPEGRALEDHARRVMAAMAGLHEAMRQPGRGGRLMLGMIPTVAPYLLPEALPLLRARDLGRDLHLREAQTDQLVQDLLQGRLDVAVVASVPDRHDLVARPLFEDPFLLAGSADQIAGLGSRPLAPRDLDPGRLLLMDEGHCLGDQALALCGLTRRDGRLDLGAASLATLCRLAAQGLGLTFLPRLALDQERAAAPGLSVMAFPDPAPARQIMLLHRATTPSGGWLDSVAETLALAGGRVMAS